MDVRSVRPIRGLREIVDLFPKTCSYRRRSPQIRTLTACLGHFSIHDVLLISVVQTIEDLFNYSGSQRMGQPFRNAGSSDWPYPTIASLSFCSQKLLAERLHSCDLLAQFEIPNDKVLFVDPLEGFSDLQQADLKWRTQLFNKELNHWDMVKADLPSALEQRFLSQISHSGPRVSKKLLGKAQPLSMHQQFQGSFLVTDPLSVFHRDDGEF